MLEKIPGNIGKDTRECSKGLNALMQLKVESKDIGIPEKRDPRP